MRLSGILKREATFLIIFLLSSLLACKVLKNGGKEDISLARADGPYVFYRNDKILIKSVISRDSVLLPHSDTQTHKHKVELSCNHGGETFNFGLKQDLLIEPFEYPMPEKMMVISDIEGNFPGFRSILQACEVIDKNYRWKFGNGHLVLVGDFFDRGFNVTEVLWLIYKLEQEAEKDGGKVHFVLGNHDIMNMYGNYHYVRDKYMHNALVMKEPYKNWYSKDSELGRWLRTKNIIEKIGRLLFVHGGISPKIAKSKLTLASLNNIARENFGKPLKKLDRKATQIYDKNQGPFWYRGLVKGLISSAELDQILQYAAADRIIVGHTIVPEITGFYNNRVIGIDLHHESHFAKGSMQCLWIENGVFYVRDQTGNKKQLF